jgi:predicted ester cyclase
MKFKSFFTGFPLACALTTLSLGVSLVEAPLSAKPLAGLSYGSSSYYGCSSAGRTLQWYRPGVPFPCAAPMDPRTKANRELYYNFMHSAWVKGDLSVLDRYVDPDTYDYSPLGAPAKGTQGFAGIIKTFRAALSDIRLDFSDTAEGNLVTHFWKLSGVHNKAQLFGVAANGRRIELNGISTVEIKGDKVVGRWSQLDIYGLWQQLGLIKSQAQPSK